MNEAREPRGVWQVKVVVSLQGEEGPPSLEYIQAKDLFPPKELVKEEENLQVRRNSRRLRAGGASCPVSALDSRILRGSPRALGSSPRPPRGVGGCICQPVH